VEGFQFQTASGESTQVFLRSLQVTAGTTLEQVFFISIIYKMSTHSLQSVEMKYLRTVTGRSRPDQIKNEDIEKDIYS
jgi:hypothetical protein